MIRRPAWLPVLAGLLVLYLAAPFAAGLVELRHGDWRGADLPRLADALGVSVLSATLATLLIALGGIPLGYLLARVQTRAASALGFVVQLPLALPPLTSGVLLLFLLGDAGGLGRMFTDSFAGIVLAESFVAAPFLIIAARSAFASIDPNLEDVAATLGHGPAAIFLRVSLKLGARTIGAGLLLTWLRAFGEFGATVTVAYHPYSLPVFTFVAFGSEGLPAMLPILAPTLVAALTVMGLSQTILGRRRRHPSVGALPPFKLPAGVPADARGRPLALSLYNRFNGFELAVAWRTNAKRLGILGPSGSGKSLTLRLIAGLGSTGGCRVQFGGRDLSGVPPEGRSIAYVPQNYGLFDHLSVAEQVGFAVGADPARVSFWIDRLGLTPLAKRRPGELSLGQQQRVALARALSRPSARLILLDEPFSALDAALRLHLRRELLALQAELDATTILVTHDPDEALLLADELLIIDNGRVLQSGPAGLVYRRPVNEATARLLGADMVGRGRATAPDRIDLGGGAVLTIDGPFLSAGTQVGWSVRPHEVRLALPGQAGIQARILATCRSNDGSTRVTLRLGDTMIDALTDPEPLAETCTVFIHPHAVQVWPV